MASETIGKKRVPGGRPLAIGRRQDGYVHLTGRIDEVRLYRRALSEMELTKHATDPAAITKAEHEKDLLGYWSFDDAPELDKVIDEMRERVGLEPPYRKRLLE